MNKKSMFRWLTAGGAVLLIVLLSCAYSIVENESRLVAPMDFSTYQFRIQDLPMLIAIPLLIVYILALIVRLFLALKQQRLQDQPGYTRRVDPRFGLFGFFGFYYEGKMSGTLADEMFEEHRVKAQLKAYKVGMSLIFAILWLVGFGLFNRQLDYAAIYLTIGISLAYAVTLFLSEYLLYRYEHQE